MLCARKLHLLEEDALEDKHPSHLINTFITSKTEGKRAHFTGADPKKQAKKVEKVQELEIPKSKTSFKKGNKTVQNKSAAP